MTPAAIVFWAGIAGAVAYLPLCNRAESWPRSLAKTLPLALFTLAAWQAGAPAFLTMALFLSALGDFALSRPGRMAFLYGLAGFALAHVVFIFLFQSLDSAPLWETFASAPPAALALLGLALSSELWLAPHTGALRGPVRIYVVLITAMGLAALALPPGLDGVAVGAAAFIFSDLILAIRLFRLTPEDPRARVAGWVLWTLYIAGQALILGNIATL